MVRALIGIMMIAAFLTGCGETSNPPGAAIANATVPVEVDWQTNCSPFALNSANSVKGKFPPCCKPDFIIDDQNLAESVLVLDARPGANYLKELFQYWYQHRMNTWYDSTLAVNKCYVCGIQLLKTPGGDTLWTTAGVTLEGDIFESFTYLCREAIGTQIGDAGFELKCCCHELGHQFAHLSHLCNADSTFNNVDHSDLSCLMGQGRSAVCTGQDLLADIHFCSWCLDSLCRAEGREEVP